MNTLYPDKKATAPTQRAKAHIRKRSIVLDGLKTSVSLEDAFWDAIREIADVRSQSVIHLISEINNGRDHANFSSAIRLYVLSYYRDRS